MIRLIAAVVLSGCIAFSTSEARAQGFGVQFRPTLPSSTHAGFLFTIEVRETGGEMIGLVYSILWQAYPTTAPLPDIRPDILSRGSPHVTIHDAEPMVVTLVGSPRSVISLFGYRGRIETRKAGKAEVEFRFHRDTLRQMRGAGIRGITISVEGRDPLAKRAYAYAFFAPIPADTPPQPKPPDKPAPDPERSS